MPINKSALVRYQTLDRCFSDQHRKYYIYDLMDACQEALFKLYDTKETISRRSIFYDMEFMSSAEGYNAPIERHADGRKTYYRYSDPSYTINRQPLNELETTQLKEAFGLLSRLSGRHEFTIINDLLPKIEKYLDLDILDTSPIISYEENKDLRNVGLVAEMFNAIRDHKVLNVHYKSFKAVKDERYTFHPYFLKQYNNRWFVFGLCPELFDKYDFNPVNFALDRIQKIGYENLLYQLNESIDFDTYFDDIIGVTKPADAQIQKIVIRVSPDKKPYIETKPLHMSQKRLKADGDYFITSIKVIPNFELYTHLLSYGPDITILEPEVLKEEMKRRVTEMGRGYGLKKTNQLDNEI